MKAATATVEAPAAAGVATTAWRGERASSGSKS
jgi:hypothetical protein